MRDPEHASIEQNPYFEGWLPTPFVEDIPFEHGTQVRNYNPALCTLPDGTLWIVWRVEMDTGLSQLACGVLDPDVPEIQEPRWLNVDHPNPEDPRLIRCGNAVWINYLEVNVTRFGVTTTQVMRQVDPDLKEVVGKRIAPPVGKNGIGVEKNWTMFAAPGHRKPLFHYSPESGGAYSLNGKEIGAPQEEVWRHPCGSWSGRSQAYLVDGKYVAIGGGAYYWPGHLKRYFLSAWSFGALSPHTPLEVSREPLAWASEEDGRIPSPRSAKHKPCVIFTGGAQPMDDGTWLVPIGIHDSCLALLRIPYNQFNLVPLAELDGQERRQSYQDARKSKRAKLTIRQFRPMANPPGNDRAIVYPWKHDASKWQELRYSLRSIDKFFEDRECPIYILGTKMPNFLLHGDQRVKFLSAWSYWEALSQGVQMAKQVLYMNDDVFLLRRTEWADCAGGLYLGDINTGFVDMAGPQRNAWREGVVRILKKLRERGIEDFRIYSTHTPYVFDRDKARAVLQEFGVWDKMPFELAYFHLHGESRKINGNEKVMEVPFGKARFLNVVDHKLSPELKEEIKELLPDYAPWELKRPFRA